MEQELQKPQLTATVLKIQSPPRSRTLTGLPFGHFSLKPTTPVTPEHLTYGVRDYSGSSSSLRLTTWIFFGSNVG
jgi:hypothetical protein